jgi:hypothetical protein
MSSSFRWARGDLAAADLAAGLAEAGDSAGAAAFQAAAGRQEAAAPQGAGDDPRAGRGGARRSRLRRRAAQDSRAPRLRPRRRLHLSGRGVFARRLHARSGDAAAAALVHQSFRTPHLYRLSRSAWRARPGTGRRWRSSSCAASTARAAECSSMCRWPSTTSGSFRPRMRRRQFPARHGKPPSMRRLDLSPPGRRKRR